MRATITENGEEVGFVSDGDGEAFEYEYRGSSGVAESGLEEISESATEYEPGYGPGGAVTETERPASPSEKFGKAADLLAGRPDTEVVPDDSASEGVVDKTFEFLRGVFEAGSGR